LTFLAAHVCAADSHNSCQYWRDIMATFMAELCRCPEGEDLSEQDLGGPAQEVLLDLCQRIPAVVGAEYQSVERLQKLWQRWINWVKTESEDDLAAFLHRYTPKWTRVGRITLHLAENKDDDECPFAFMATYASGLNRQGGLLRHPLAHAMKEFAGKDNKSQLMELLAPLTKASKRCPFMKELLDSGDIFHPMVWTPEEAHCFLQRVIDYEDSGLLVQIPNWWMKRPRPRVSVSIDAAKSTSLGADELLKFNIGVALGEAELTAQEIRQLMENGADGLVRIRGQWLELDRHKLGEALSHWETVKEDHGDGMSFIEGMRLLAGADQIGAGDDVKDQELAWFNLEAGKHLKKALQYLREPEQLQGRQPATLKAKLRPYQLHGLNWLWVCSKLGLGCCLADDMGLGKTIQILALLLRIKASRQKQQPSLLIVPASLMNNWLAEAERFAPSLCCEALHPGICSRERWQELKDSEGKALGRPDLVITTYGMLSRLNWIKNLSWQLQILDEAQAIKNPSTTQTKAVKKIRAQQRIALTGTPVENRLGDLWSLFDHLNPGLLGPSKQFGKFCKSLHRESGVDYRPLRRLVSPYILRRMKTDPGIADDLPGKTEMLSPCSLSKKQASIYAKVVKTLAQALAKQKDESGSAMKRRGLVLKCLTEFKQICNHPAQYSGDGSYDSKDSGKFMRLKELCEEIASRGERVLIFTQFKEIMPALDEALIDVFGRPGPSLHGGSSVKKRKAMVEAFQREDGPPYFLLSLKAGGTGLNLTAASHVIHFDRWWNPAVETQATDRAFRIGQKNKVMVHKFVTLGTLEEKIDRLLTEKQEMSTALLSDGGELALSEMTDEELLNTVSLDLQQVMS
jgi:non-specific serine/threonine protein kinase